MSFSDETPKWSDLCRVHGFQALPPHRPIVSHAAILRAAHEMQLRLDIARENAERAAMWGME